MSDAESAARASSVVKVIEVSSSSNKGFDDAVQSGLKKVAKTLKGIQGAWVNEMKVITNGEGKVVEWRVNLKISFLVQ